MKSEDKKAIEYAKYIEEYCTKNVHSNYKNCVFYMNGWCAFDLACLDGVADNWSLPELEEENEV